MRNPRFLAALDVTLVVGAIAAAVIALAGCEPVTTDPEAGPTPPPISATTTTATTAPGPAHAAADLAQLPTVTTPAGGYERAAFGGGWTDPKGAACDTRQQVLERDLTDESTTRYCYIATGTLVDPYSGRIITGPTRDLDIDHVVALADAWRSGANAWTAAEREAFANDLGNLVATDASTNRSKGDQGPDTWSPVSKVGACVYAARYVRVKAEYHLGVTPEQRTAVADMLRDTCV